MRNRYEITMNRDEITMNRAEITMNLDEITMNRDEITMNEETGMVHMHKTNEPMRYRYTSRQVKQMGN